MSNCSQICGIPIANIPKPSTDCKKVPKIKSLKDLAFLPCQVDSGIVTDLPAWSAPVVDKQTYLTSLVDAFVSLNNLRKITIGKPETAEVKILTCQPPSKIVTKQTIEIEDAVLQASLTDDFLDYTIWRYLQDNITKLYGFHRDCDGNLYPWVEDFTSATPKFVNVNGEFYTEEEELSACKTIEVKKATLEVCYDIKKFNTPWLLAADVPTAWTDILFP